MENEARQDCGDLPLGGGELNWILDQPCRVESLAVGTNRDHIVLLLEDGTRIKLIPHMSWMGMDRAICYLHADRQ